MRDWFKPNIELKGRILRGLFGAMLILAGAWLLGHVWWLSLVCFACGGFALFEALRGWCAARACGIKTRF